MISEKIQACEFSGQDEKNIEKYLVELELNINSCGWGNKKDIKEDAYIWDEINQVKKVDNEGDFKKHKELLIYYISIMLKEDWDRSKSEWLFAGFCRNIDNDTYKFSNMLFISTYRSVSALYMDNSCR